MWKNQKGFSLIELIIVIAMLGILAGSAVSVVGYVRYANTKKAVREVDNALSKLRLDTMSQKERRYLYIYRHENGYMDSYYALLLDEKDVTGYDAEDTLLDQLNDNGTRLCGTNVTIKKDGVPVGEDDYICIAYKKNGVFLVKGDLSEENPSEWKYTNVESIEISGSGSYTISLNPDTGRHSIE